LLFTLLGALPLGVLVRRRHVAVLAYLTAGSFVFTLQTVTVLLTWMSGGKGIGGGSGFGESPSGTFPIDYASGEVIAYGLVNLLMTLTGVGLVLVGGRLRARRSVRRRITDAATVAGS
jgi:hypothetical protein